jgi:hypothetical protein
MQTKKQTEGSSDGAPVLRRQFKTVRHKLMNERDGQYLLV